MVKEIKMSKIKSFLMELREYVETHPESPASKMILEEDRRQDQEFEIYNLDDLSLKKAKKVLESSGYTVSKYDEDDCPF